jgi:LPXTG-site transpeptidase (sortase) family protein
MHIPYNEKNIGQSFDRRGSVGAKFWQFIRFTVVTGMVFVISFFILNYSAYEQIFFDFFRPEAQVKAQEILENASGEGDMEVDSSMLLEVLPEKREVIKKFNMIDLPVAPTDFRLVIPKIGKSVPIVTMGTEHIEGANWNELEKQIQESLRFGVVHYPGTAMPGNNGNVFVTGHSSYYPWDPGKYKDVFATLSKLDIGDRYYIYNNQKKFVYEVVDKKEVRPSNVDVLEQDQNKKISTLMTCTPVGTTLRRLIISAELVN